MSDEARTMPRKKSELIGEIVVLRGDVERLREWCAAKDAEIAFLKTELGPEYRFWRKRRILRRKRRSANSPRALTAADR